MSDTNRIVVAVLAVLALIAAFWLTLLAPKREESSALGKEIETLEAQVAEVRQQADLAEEAKQGFAGDYEQLVLLGKAVPGDEDTASLLVQLDQISQAAGVDFRSLQLSESATGSEPVPPPAATPTAPAPPADPAAGATPAAATVPPTEAVAATLPIGATIGTAGLGVMPYELSFKGQFFQIADFLAGLDQLVETTGGRLSANGRLFTVDGFSLAPDEEAGFPNLEATVGVTTYLTPPGQGLTAGATPAAPAPAPAGTSTTPVATTP